MLQDGDGNVQSVWGCLHLSVGWDFYVFLDLFEMATQGMNKVPVK